MDVNENLATTESEDAMPAPCPNPAWPFLAIVGLMYLFLAPAYLLTNAPHTSIVSLSMFLFAVGTIYLASRPYTESCRIMDIAWGGLMTFFCLSGLLAAWRVGSMDAAIASLLALALVSPVLCVALNKKSNRLVRTMTSTEAREQTFT